jgi:hypothetical protein
MKVLFLILIFSSSFFTSFIQPEEPINGQQPNLSVDSKGHIRMVYGYADKIYCMTSTDNGLNFSPAVLVAEIKGMHLGNTRGPQIASSKHLSMISAIDKLGAIHSFVLDHLKGGWKPIGIVNDKPGSAVEGLMAITADKEDNFYSVWLDIRQGGKNNIYFSSFNVKSKGWMANSLVYQSPDKHVCECCRPNIAVNKNKIVIGFRNWIMGSRDIYYSVSNDKGKSFSPAEKSGSGTWQLNACPMDGGGLVIDEAGKVSAAWRRNGDVYYWEQNKQEQKLAAGRDVSMTRYRNLVYVVWQDKKNISIMNMKTRQTTLLGTGSSPKVYILANGKAICFWEDNKTVRYKIV